MAVQYRPKLIEVAIPLDDINAQSAREKSIRHGHPSTLHLWWARRPLAACRAILFSQLVDDPSAYVEDEVKQKAERERLHGIIRRLIRWENSSDQAILDEARREIIRSCEGAPPPILDPFCGGGSIPLEAQRLGLEARAADLNPVAVLITKALLEIPAKFADHPPVFPGAAGERISWPAATGLAEDVRRYGAWMRDEAEKRIGHLYPKAKISGVDTTVIAWIWVRTVACPNPACGGTMPLVRSFWLGKKQGKARYVIPVPDGKRVRFEIAGPGGRPREGTVSRTGAVCLLCGTPVLLSYIRAEGKAKRMGTQLMAIAAEGKRQRYYLPPAEEHEKAADVPRPDDVPDEELPRQALGFRVQGYGMRTWADLFTNRQLIALTTFSSLIQEARETARTHGAEPGYTDAITTILALITSRLADRHSKLVPWDSSTKQESPSHVFTRQAIAMTWDTAEANPFGQSTGNFKDAVEQASSVLERLPAKGSGTVIQQDARYADAKNALVVATDPPYYDNVGYADLSDFFYVWLRRSLSEVYPEITATLLAPKADEIVADPFRHGGVENARKFFKNRFEEVFSTIRRNTPAGYPISFFYAYKQSVEDNDGGHTSTGWEILLDSILDAGWTITATWPIRTELQNRLRTINSNALVTSIIVTCRPRDERADASDRRSFLKSLRAELPGALQKLKQSNIAPLDTRQAVIGPGMAIFSRYSRVNEANGERMPVHVALKLINQVLDELQSQLSGNVSADTRWCVEWFKQHGFDEGLYDAAETLSKGMDTGIETLVRVGTLKSRGGKVKLLSVPEMPRNYDPGQDERASEWRICLHLAQRLRDQGTGPAAELMAAARGVVDLDNVQNLAYLLSSIAEGRGWAETALWFNNLGTEWTSLEDESRRPSRFRYATDTMDSR
jgi:putative DNA methylase